MTHPNIKTKQNTNKTIQNQQKTMKTRKNNIQFLSLDYLLNFDEREGGANNFWHGARKERELGDYVFYFLSIICFTN